MHVPKTKTHAAKIRTVIRFTRRKDATCVVDYLYLFLIIIS